MTEQEREMGSLIAPRATTSKEFTWLLRNTVTGRKGGSKQFEHTRSFLISESLITLRKIRFAVAHEISPKAEALSSGHRLWGFFLMVK